MREKVATLLLLFLSTTLGASLAEKEKELRGSLASKDRGRVFSLSRELVSMEDPEAVELVARYALLVNSYAVERKIAGLLAGVPQGLREPVLKLARTHDTYQVRVILAAVLAAYGDDASFDVLCEMVGDRVPAVKLAAIEWLLKKRDARAIGAFIKELAKWGRRGGVVAGDLRQALHTLTGQYFSNATDWKKWWNINKASFNPATVKHAQRRGHGHTSVLTPKFFGHEIVSKKILFVLDMSGSMRVRDEPIEERDDGTIVRGTKVVDPKKKKAEEQKKKELPLQRERLYRVQQELIRTIDTLSPDTVFTVMAFNHKIKVLSDKPRAATASFKKNAKAFAKSFRPEGETWTDSALKRAFEMKNRIDTIYLLSDGAPRRKNKLLPVEPIYELVRTANRFHKIKIYTVGFVQAGRSMRRFLYTLASQNYGEYRGLK